MGVASPAITGFNSGLWAPQAGARADLERHIRGCIRLNNFIPEVEGPATKRPGAKYIAPPKYDDRSNRMIRFVFSNEQAYALEFGDFYMRVHRDQATVLDPDVAAIGDVLSISQTNPIEVKFTAPHTFTAGKHIWLQDTDCPEVNGSFFRILNTTADAITIEADGAGVTLQTVAAGTGQLVYEVATLYAESVLKTIKTAPSLDVMYLACPTVPFSKVTRFADDDFRFDEVWSEANCTDDTIYGAGTWPPFQGESVQSDAFRFLGNAYGTPGVTTFDIEDLNATFTAADVGKFITYPHGASPNGGLPFGKGFAIVSAFVSSTQLTLTVMSDGEGVGNSSGDFQPFYTWGQYDPERGYPKAVGFHESRMYVGGGDLSEQTWHASFSGDFESHRKYITETTVFGPGIAGAEGSITSTINSDTESAIEWFRGHDELLVGTIGAEFTIAGPDITQAITPTNFFTKKRASYGSRRDVEPVAVDTAVLFCQRAGRKLKELSYQVQADRFAAPDMTRLSREAIIGRLKYMVYQQEPNRIVWCVMEDGTVSSFTYEREDQVAAWATHSFAGPRAFVDSMCVIPSANDDEDEVWVSIRRTHDDGRVVRSIELMNDFWDRRQAVEDAVFSDSAILYEETRYAATSAFIVESLGVPVSNLVNLPGHPFVENQRIEIARYSPDGDLLTRQFSAFDVTASSFRLKYLDGTGLVLETDTFPTASTNDVLEFRATTNRLTGAWHLAGETVSVLAGGKVEHPVTVSASGVMDLPFWTGRVVVGRAYEAELRTNRLEAGARDGTAQGKVGTFRNCVLRLDQTGRGLYAGTDFDNMDLVEWRTKSAPQSAPDQLFDGDTPRFAVPGGWEQEKTLAFRHGTALPCSILGAFPTIQTEDG